MPTLRSARVLNNPSPEPTHDPPLKLGSVLGEQPVFNPIDSTLISAIAPVHAMIARRITLRLHGHDDVKSPLVTTPAPTTPGPPEKTPSPKLAESAVLESDARVALGRRSAKRKFAQQEAVTKRRCARFQTDLRCCEVLDQQGGTNPDPATNVPVNKGATNVPLNKGAGIVTDALAARAHSLIAKANTFNLHPSGAMQAFRPHGLKNVKVFECGALRRLAFHPSRKIVAKIKIATPKQGLVVVPMLAQRSTPTPTPGPTEGEDPKRTPTPPPKQPAPLLCSNGPVPANWPELALGLSDVQLFECFATCTGVVSTPAVSTDEADELLDILSAMY